MRPQRVSLASSVCLRNLWALVCYIGLGSNREGATHLLSMARTDGSGTAVDLHDPEEASEVPRSMIAGGAIGVNVDP